MLLDLLLLAFIGAAMLLQRSARKDANAAAAAGGLRRWGAKGVAAAVMVLVAAIFMFLRGFSLLSASCESGPQRASRLANERCDRARFAPDAAVRRQALDESRSQLAAARASGMAYACELLAGEVYALENQGECPEVVPANARCTCGTMRFPEDAPCERPSCGADVGEPRAYVQEGFGRMLVCNTGDVPRPQAVREDLSHSDGVTPCWMKGGELLVPGLTCRLHADLDGDGRRDRILLVEWRSPDYSTRDMKVIHGLHQDPFGDGLVADRVEHEEWVESGELKRGFAVFLAGKDGGRVLLSGRAGWPFRTGALDDITGWTLVEKAKAPAGAIPRAARGDAVRLDGTGLLLYWDGARLVAARDPGQKRAPAKRKG